MKKLFLYLSILYAAVFVFFVAYIVSRQKFSESSKDIVANTVQATTEEATTEEKTTEKATRKLYPTFSTATPLSRLNTKKELKDICRRRKASALPQ